MDYRMKNTLPSKKWARQFIDRWGPDIPFVLKNFRKISSDLVVNRVIRLIEESGIMDLGTEGELSNNAIAALAEGGITADDAAAQSSALVANIVEQANARAAAGDEGLDDDKLAVQSTHALSLAAAYAAGIILCFACALTRLLV